MQAELVETAMTEYGMNLVASEEISLDRTVPDTRLLECKDWCVALYSISNGLLH